MSGSGTSTITVTLSSTLAEYGKAFYVQIAANAFHNIAGVFFSGIADTTTWNFTTQPVDSPVGGGSGKNYRFKLKKLQTASSTASSNLGVVRVVSKAGIKGGGSSGGASAQKQLITPDSFEQEDITIPLEEDVFQPDIPENSDIDILTDVSQLYWNEYRFKRRVCKRVAKRFAANVTMLSRVNARLANRFDFICTGEGLPK